MTGALVDRATSDLLIGPDWAMNVEICDILNRDPGQAKEVVKDLRKRIGHKNPKVQLLALTLLETMIKNCGDIVHMYVAEKDLLHEMVKIVKKKHPDAHVKEKILVLIDTWQEAFGGPQARYPQYYAAYLELLRAGAVFPRRSGKSAPKLPHSQTKPQRSYPPSGRGPEYRNKAPESSVPPDVPVLSLAEIKNARGIMDVLSEMLNVLDPGNKEELKQEVIVQLVGQCRTYRQRVVHLVNTTSDEELLSQGLALNDDLQKVLAKHDSIAAGIADRVEKRKSLQALVDVDDPSTSEETDQRSSTASNQLPLQQLVPAPSSSDGSATSSAKVDPNLDFLCGEDYNKPATENPLALVPVGEAHTNSASDQNILALADMFPLDNSNSDNTNPGDSLDSNSSFPAQQTYPAGSNLQLQAQETQQPALSANGDIARSGASQFEQGIYDQGAQLNQTSIAWNGQAYIPQQQALLYDDEGRTLPPPPWEVQSMQNELPALHPQHMLDTQHTGLQPQHVQSNQFAGMYPPMQNNQMTAMYPQQMFGGQGVQLTGYGHGQQPDAQIYDPSRPAYPYSVPNELSQRLYGLSVQDNSTYAGNNSSYQMPTSSSSYLQQSNKPSKPEDKLFGDLVSLAKAKQK